MLQRFDTSSVSCCSTVPAIYQTRSQMPVTLWPSRGVLGGEASTRGGKQSDAIVELNHVGKTVVLVGYSASGKSTIGKNVKKRFAKNGSGLEYRDSDEEIGTRFGGGIADCYLALGYGAAIKYIEAEERTFLDSIQPSTTPRIVVTGPNVPLREAEWSDFLARVKPIVYYLKISAKKCRSRLAGREQTMLKKNPDLEKHANFGCWNFGTLRERGVSGYVLVDEDEAVRRITTMMHAQVSAYEKAVTPEHVYDSKDLEKNANEKALVARIETDLLS